MTYNFYLSQLRIRVEMCFGKLMMRWRTVCCSLGFSSEVKTKFIWVGAKLHNYVINADNLDFVGTHDYDSGMLGFQALTEDACIHKVNSGYFPIPLEEEEAVNGSCCRQIVCELVER